MKYLLIGLVFLLTGNLFFNTLQQEESVAPSVEIKKTSDGHLIGIVKNHPSYANTLFALQIAQELGNFSPITVNNANIQLSDGCVQFSSAERTIVFKLTDKMCSSGGSGANSTTYGGYGLVIQKDQEKYNAIVNFTGPVLPPIQGILKCKCIPTTQQAPSGSCLSGGQGSTNCSYKMSGGATVVGTGGNIDMECNTTCSQGYYACCYWE